MTYEQVLETCAAEDENLLVLTAENRVAIRNLPGRLGDRFMDFGICEQTMVGAAAGLALRGRIPVVHALASFLTMRAFEFIRTDVGYPGLSVKLVGGVPGFLSEANGPTHQAIEDIAIMRGIPDMHIFCPADAEELAAGMPAIIRDPAPWYIRYNALPAAVEHTASFGAGKAERLSTGSDVTILTYGFLVREAVRAAAILATGGLAAGVVNLRTLKPLDEDAVLTAAGETSMLVTVEDHFQTGGLASIVAELFLRYHVGARVLPIALPDRWFHPALLQDVLETEGFTGEKLAERIARDF
ncbi:MAG TPA: transketolase C-terminal domain-containing protein [Bacteroidota bacterium]